jgi:hypothetical protein
VFPDLIRREKKEMKQDPSATSFSCDGVNGAKGYIIIVKESIWMIEF